MVCLVEPAYAVARGVDELSRRLGIGAFEVGDNWKCPSCFENDSPNFPLCTECKSSYVYEVTILKRSDSFNHRRDVRIATAGLGTGLSAGLLNASMKIWPWSSCLSSFTEAIAARVPTSILTLLQEGSRVRAYYNFTLMVSSLCSGIMLSGIVIVFLFLAAIYPSAAMNLRSARKQMTPIRWVPFVVISIVYYWVIFHGVQIEEFILVSLPMYLGCITLSNLVCSRNRLDGKETKDESSLKIAEEGKKS